MALTLKQQRFIEEYLIDGNATAAYKRAGYTATGHAAEVNASRLLSHAEVQSAIQAARAEQSARLKTSADEVLIGLRREAEYRGDGSTHAARIRAWELLGKTQGLFRETPPPAAEVNIYHHLATMTYDELQDELIRLIGR